jgi:hypothetical protein
MKTKTFLLLCLFLGIGLTQLSAQPDNKKGTGSVVSGGQWGWWTPIYCNGVIVDELEGIGDIHVVDHYKNGVWQWETMSYKNGIGTSDWTDETFTFTELDKTFYSNKLNNWEWTCNTHVKGDKGSLYNLSFVFIWNTDINDWSMSVKNATCTGNSKY